ncbi:MAG: tripartite tricarboxylate transporter TctB family protein [Dermatophilaceae bacterium]
MTNASPPAPSASAGPVGTAPASAASASSERFRDVVAGVVFVGFGGAFAVGALGYDLGTTLEPGPGYYPLALGGLLTVLGLAVVVKGLLGRGQQALDSPVAGPVPTGPATGRPVSSDTVPGAPVPGEPRPGGGDTPSASATDAGTTIDTEDLDDARGRVPWVAAVLVIGAIIGFAFSVRTLGLVPAVFGCAFVSALAGYRWRVHAALAVAAVLTALCYLIFVLLLQLRIPEFGTLFTG